MAQAREIKKRIRSVQSTKKITRTMELVATSKMKKAQDRVYASRPYASKMRDILATMSQAGGGDIDHPLLRVPETSKNTAVFMITSNRGLCGAYNSNVIRLVLRFLAEEQEAGRRTSLHVSGKKAANVFKWRGTQVDKAYSDPSDMPRYDHAEEIGGGFIDGFSSGAIDKVVIAYTRFVSAGRLEPTIETLLPLQPDALEGAAKDEDAKGGARPDYLFEPSAEEIVGTLLPLMVKMRFYEVLLNAQASEHSARMVAMKTATDNAGELISSLERVYNRERQAQITQELAEILGGVEALKG